MYVAAGQPFTATLVDPTGLSPDYAFGARIEVPVTRAIVGTWTAATLSGNVWSVDLEAPPAQVASPSYGLNPTMSQTLQAGEFEIVWMDNGPDPRPDQVVIMVPLFTSSGGVTTGAGAGVPDYGAPDPTAVRCTVADVAALERNRTIGPGGVRVGTFDSTTKPTDVEVGGLIDQAVDLVLVAVQPQFNPDMNSQVARAVALQTALLLESSDYIESNEPDVARKERMLATLMAGLNAQMVKDIEEQLSSTGGSVLV
jgi:hypothetical protein